MEKSLAWEIFDKFNGIKRKRDFEAYNVVPLLIERYQAYNSFRKKLIKSELKKLLL